MTPEQKAKFLGVIDKVEALFKQPEFKGRFNMRSFGDHVSSDHTPTENNSCGTVACLAGWMATVDKEFAKASNAEWYRDSLGWRLTVAPHVAMDRLYGISYSDTENLFYWWEPDRGKDLAAKLREARVIAERS